MDLDVHGLKCGGGWWAVSDGGSWTITSAQQGMTLWVSVCVVGPEQGRRSKREMPFDSPRWVVRRSVCRVALPFLCTYVQCCAGQGRAGHGELSPPQVFARPQQGSSTRISHSHTHARTHQQRRQHDDTRSRHVPSRNKISHKDSAVWLPPLGQSRDKNKKSQWNKEKDDGGTGRGAKSFR